ncbi:MAG TPA: hypothetical protein VGC85_00945 [Chthoniobacterales bacterium]
MPTTAPAQKEGRIVFTCGSAEHSVRDVIDAAHFRGEVASHWQEFLRRAAAEQHANDSGTEPDSSAIDEAAVAFRYEYDLITAEETEAWLDARSVSLAEFGDYLTREYWGKSAARSEPPRIRFDEASAEQRETFVADLTFSGELDRMAARLAWRVAAREGAEAAAIDAERALFLKRHELGATDVSDWLNAIGRDEVWLREMLELEAAYETRRARLLTADAIKREITALRLPLTRLEVETLELESHDAANEALMCVRDDGMSMEEVANEGRYPYRRAEMVLEQVPVELQQKFLSVTGGTVLDPVPRDDGFVLSRLIAKHEPTAADPQVRARIEERILNRHFADLTAGRIKWSLPPNTSA